MSYLYLPTLKKSNHTTAARFDLPFLFFALVVSTVGGGGDDDGGGTPSSMEGSKSSLCLNKALWILATTLTTRTAAMIQKP